MKWKTIRIGICAFACLVLPLYLAIADTLVNGAVRGHWTVEEGPYFAFESIYLDYNDTLIIDPGVEVKFGSQTRFDVHGVLIAVGTEEDSIIFRPLSNELGDWYWLKIEESNASESRLSYCKIVLSQWGLSLFESEPIITNCRISNHLNACVRFEASRAQILNSTICHSGHDGIMIAENSRAVIRHCYIFDCGSDGIAARTGSNPVIDGVTVSSCRNHGINLSDAGPCSLKYNRIIECSENGIRIFISAATKLYRNIIYECNGDEGIYLNNCRDALILNNTIVNNSGIGLSLISSTSSVINNIITQSGHDGIFVRGGELIQLQFNDVWASGRYDYSGTRAGYGDINENPMLVDPAEGDFHPQEGSPVIDAGCPDYEDPDGTRSDMGVEFFNQNRPPVINRYWPVDL